MDGKSFITCIFYKKCYNSEDFGNAPNKTDRGKLWQIKDRKRKKKNSK